MEIATHPAKSIYDLPVDTFDSLFTAESKAYSALDNPISREVYRQLRRRVVKDLSKASKGSFKNTAHQIICLMRGAGTRSVSEWEGTGPQPLAEDLCVLQEVEENWGTHNHFFARYIPKKTLSMGPGQAILRAAVEAEETHAGHGVASYYVVTQDVLDLRNGHVAIPTKDSSLRIMVWDVRRIADAALDLVLSDAEMFEELAHRLPGLRAEESWYRALYEIHNRSLET